MADRPLCPRCASHFIVKPSETGWCRFCEQEVRGTGWQNLRNRSQVRCIETGIVFDSMMAAERALGLPRTSVGQSIAKGYAAKGYHFERVIS